MSDRRYFLMAFKVQKLLPSAIPDENLKVKGQLVKAIVTVEKLVQAQTEIEAIEKFQQFSLGKNETMLSYENKTVE